MRLVTVLLLAMVLPRGQAVQRRKFHHWLPYYEYLWKQKSQMCQPELKNYYTNIRTAQDPYPCAAVVDCLLTDIPGSIQSNIATADILLGLTPQIIGFVGPAGGEVAALSTDSPLFAALLSFGFPSRSVRGLFVSVDVAKLLRKPVARTARAYHSWLGKQPPRVRQVVFALCYLVAGGAVANNIYTSIYLDLRTVSGWRCGVDYLPLAWSLSGVLIALVEMLAVRVRNVPVASQRAWLRHCHRRDGSRLPPCILPDAEDGLWTEILFGLANFFGIVQITLGTIVLSALLFISFLDALPIIFRYWASAGVCSLLLRLELAGLRCKLETIHQGRTGEGTRHFQSGERRTGLNLELSRTHP